MARPRTLPDTEVHAAVLRLLAEGGEKAVAFAPVSRATGLAGSTLVQRYGSAPGMLAAALGGAWAAAEVRLAAALADAEAKGPHGLLKALDPAPPAAVLAASDRDAALRARAEAWRQAVETALAARLSPRGAPEAAAALFAAWAGASLWPGGADRGFRLKDLAKRLD